MKRKVLMIGSFLSKTTGSKGVSEKLSQSQLEESFDFILCSQFKSQIPRFIHMIWKSLTFSGKPVHIDVFSGRAFFFATITSKIARLRNKMLIMTLRGGALPSFSKGQENRMIKVLNRANVVQSPSKYLVNFFTNLGIKVSYLPNPINLKNFSYDRNDIKPFSLLWIRAFTPIYNPGLPVKVLLKVLEEYPGTTLTMVGPDKGQLSQIKSLIKNFGLENKVVTTGPINNEELYKYYQTHEVFLNTTSYESFGVAVLEAAACGIPIVSTKVGEIPYLWSDEEDILIVDEFEAEPFAKQVIRLFNEKELSTKLSINARKKAEQFDWEIIKHRWIKLFESDVRSF